LPAQSLRSNFKQNIVRIGAYRKVDTAERRCNDFNLHVLLTIEILSFLFSK